MTYHSNMTKNTMKPKMKPKMKKKELTMGQKKMMNKHKVHHTKPHMDMMTKLMKQGHTFKQAHDKTMKKIGK